MSAEVILFILAGIVSVFSAVMMLLSRNAVHSALYLILNFATIALFFLMLDAPFLALVQVAVYAGAIMVLFLFVIMLLGAERARQEIQSFRWMAPLTLTLALSFLIVVSLAFLDGNIDEQPVPPEQPRLRVINATPNYQTADIYLDDTLFASDVTFGGMADGESVPFQDVEPGEYTLRIAQAGSDGPALPLGSFEIAEGDTMTAVTYGVVGTDVNPTMTTFTEDITYFDGPLGRLIVLNAYTETPVSLVDAGSDRIFEDAQEAADAEAVVENLGIGEATEAQLVDEGRMDWVFTAGETNPDEILARPMNFDVTAGDLHLLLLAADQTNQGLRPVALPVTMDALPQFGSPESIGQVLFVDYLLPFEAVAILLLAAMVGAIVLTQRGEVKPKPGRPMRRQVSRPLTSVIASQTGSDVSESEEDAETRQPAGD